VAAGLQQRRLHEVLGVAVVAGEQIGGAQQRPPVDDDELAEPFVVVAVQRVTVPSALYTP
jgi:hypothetical protein